MSDSSLDDASIKEALEAIMRRVNAAPQTPIVQQIAARALACGRKIQNWSLERPTVAARAATIQSLIAMEMELIAVGVRPGDDTPDSTPR